MKIHLLIIATCFLFACFPAYAEEEAPTSTADDRTALELAIYSGQRALVTDTRRVSLPAGRGTLLLTDIAARITPDSLHVSCPGDTNGFRVLEQVFSYDLISRAALLERYRGETVKLMDYNRQQDRKDVVEATLLSTRDVPIYRIGNEIYIGHPGITILPDIPEDLTAEPTLSWLFENKKAGKRHIAFSYLTGNVDWRANYLLTISDKNPTGELSAWVSIDNRSGVDYRNARVSLVAGDVNKRNNREKTVFGDRMMAMQSAPASEQFQQAALFEYYRYELTRPVTIENNQSRQIELFSPRVIRPKKNYRVFSGAGRHTHQRTEEDTRIPVEVSLSFRTDEANNLDMPLPAGLVRLYQVDERDRRWFIGEDRINHSPKDADVSIKAGSAFDITAKRKQLEFRRVTSRVSESSWEIAVTNRKSDPVVVECLEQLSGDWEITKSSHPFTIVNAFTARFDLSVKPEETVILHYTVKTGA
ncbi:MAG TPA: DUF4139 domain-containing protein [Deltaproteobacteria bacterium]|nr:DUF4139 domain-containing protein [Deltaproteobacteria bacterium]